MKKTKKTLADAFGNKAKRKPQRAASRNKVVKKTKKMSRRRK